MKREMNPSTSTSIQGIMPPFTAIVCTNKLSVKAPESKRKGGAVNSPRVYILEAIAWELKLLETTRNSCRLQVRHTGPFRVRSIDRIPE